MVGQGYRHQYTSRPVSPAAEILGSARFYGAHLLLPARAQGEVLRRPKKLGELRGSQGGESFESPGEA